MARYQVLTMDFYNILNWSPVWPLKMFSCGGRTARYFLGVFHPRNTIWGSATPASRPNSTAAIICVVESAQCCEYDRLPGWVNVATALVCASAATRSCQSHSCRCGPGQSSQCNSPPQTLMDPKYFNKIIKLVAKLAQVQSIDIGGV